MPLPVGSRHFPQRPLRAPTGTHRWQEVGSALPPEAATRSRVSTPKANSAACMSSKCRGSSDGRTNGVRISACHWWRGTSTHTPRSSRTDTPHLRAAARPLLLVRATACRRAAVGLGVAVRGKACSGAGGSKLSEAFRGSAKHSPVGAVCLGSVVGDCVSGSAVLGSVCLSPKETDRPPSFGRHGVPFCSAPATVRNNGKYTV